MRTKVKNNIKNNLRKYRVWKNLTRKELAELTGVSYATIILIEDKNRCPRYQNMRKICDYFGVNIDQMFL